MNGFSESCSDADSVSYPISFLVSLHKQSSLSFDSTSLYAITISMLSAAFQLFLFLSLFLFQVTRSIPDFQVKIQTDTKNLQEAMRKIMAQTAPQTSDRTGKTMQQPPHRRLLQTDEEDEGNGVYYVKFGFGTPPEQLSTTLDSGSDVTWIHCQSCVQDCSNQDDTSKFNPHKSTTYTPLLCTSQQCQNLNPQSCNSSSQTCVYHGSVTSGDFATEIITSSGATATIPIACGYRKTETKTESSVDSYTDDNGNHVVTSSSSTTTTTTTVTYTSVTTSGMLGLGRGSQSFLSTGKYSAFSYCLPQSKGTASPDTLLSFGSTGAFSDDAFTTPMLLNSKLGSFYFVSLTGVSVNDQVFPLPPSNPGTGQGGTYIDFGTMVTKLPEDVYNEVRLAFVRAATGLTPVDANSNSMLDTCFSLTSSSEANIPDVSFHFGASPLTLPPDNVIMYGDNIMCFGFAATNGPYSVIGSHQQQGIRVRFDEDKSVVGFSPQKC